jgi:hypothetical protein
MISSRTVAGGSGSAILRPVADQVTTAVIIGTLLHLSQAGRG